MTRARGSGDYKKKMMFSGSIEAVVRACTAWSKSQHREGAETQRSTLSEELLATDRHWDRGSYYYYYSVITVFKSVT